jgi:hypothetical protein
VVLAGRGAVVGAGAAVVVGARGAVVVGARGAVVVGADVVEVGLGCVGHRDWASTMSPERVGPRRTSRTALTDSSPPPGACWFRMTLNRSPDPSLASNTVLGAGAAGRVIVWVTETASRPPVTVVEAVTGPPWVVQALPTLSAWSAPPRALTCATTAELATGLGEPVPYELLTASERVDRARPSKRVVLPGRWISPPPLVSRAVPGDVGRVTEGSAPEKTRGPPTTATSTV